MNAAHLPASLARRLGSSMSSLECRLQSRSIVDLEVRSWVRQRPKKHPFPTRQEWDSE